MGLEFIDSEKERQETEGNEMKLLLLSLLAASNLYARQHCKYTICSTEIDKPVVCTTRERDLEPSEMSDLFFNPNHPGVESYDCKPIPRVKKK